MFVEGMRAHEDKVLERAHGPAETLSIVLLLACRAVSSPQVPSLFVQAAAVNSALACYRVFRWEAVQTVSWSELKLEPERSVVYAPNNKNCSRPQGSAADCPAAKDECQMWRFGDEFFE